MRDFSKSIYLQRWSKPIPWNNQSQPPQLPYTITPRRLHTRYPYCLNNQQRGYLHHRVRPREPEGGDICQDHHQQPSPSTSGGSSWCLTGSCQECPTSDQGGSQCPAINIDKLANLRTLHDASYKWIGIHEGDDWDPQIEEVVEQEGDTGFTALTILKKKI